MSKAIMFAYQPVKEPGDFPALANNPNKLGEQIRPSPRRWWPIPKNIKTAMEV